MSEFFLGVSVGAVLFAVGLKVWPRVREKLVKYLMQDPD